MSLMGLRIKEPVSDFVFAKIPQKCYQARKCTTIVATHNFIKQIF